MSLRIKVCQAAAIVALLAFVQTLHAQPKSFSELITSRTAETFAAVREYAKTAEGANRDAAGRWLFRTATDNGWESQVIDLAASYADSPDADPASMLLAEQVRLMGLAQSGKAEDAVERYSMFLRKLRLRSPNLGSDLGQALAMQFQLAGDRDAARAVYEKLNGAFFLNAEVKDWCDRRLTRLELSGKPAPEITGMTVAGEAFDVSPWKGKVVIVDFWATNCRPCLEDLPQLREIYTEFHPLGLEIVGVSFDEDEIALTEFLEVQKLPWTILRNDAETPQRFHVELIPCLVVIDQTGQVAITDAKVSHLRGALRKLLSP
jgi:peroxiredoxin